VVGLSVALAGLIAIAIVRAAGDGWGVQTSGTTNDLNAVSCSSTSNCWAVGGGGTIVATVNGGTTWTAQTSNTTQTLYGVYCYDNNHCEAGGAAGTIIGTSNAGATWTTQTSNITNGSRRRGLHE